VYVGSLQRFAFVLYRCIARTSIAEVATPTAVQVVPASYCYYCCTAVAAANASVTASVTANPNPLLLFQYTHSAHQPAYTLLVIDTAAVSIHYHDRAVAALLAELQRELS
jgi:hypothetical protein